MWFILGSGGCGLSRVKSDGCGISGQLNLGLQSHLEGDTEGTSPLYHNPFTCMAPNSSVDTLPSASLILASSPKKASYWDFFFVAAKFVHTGMLVFQQFSSTACFFFGGGGGGGGGGRGFLDRT